MGKKKKLLIDKTIRGNIIGREILGKYFPKEIDVFCSNVFCVLSELRVQLSGELLWGFSCPKAVRSRYLCSGSAEPSSSLWRGIMIREFSPSKSTTDRKRCAISALGMRRILLKMMEQHGHLALVQFVRGEGGTW